MVTNIVGFLLMGAGLTLFWRGYRDLGANLTAFPRPLETAQLVESGAYGLVRHPLYGALVLAGFGWALLTASVPGLASRAR